MVEYYHLVAIGRASKAKKGEVCSFLRKNAEDGNSIEAMSHTKAFSAPGANAPEFPLSHIL